MSSLNIETRTFLLPSSVSYSEVIHRTDYNEQITFLTFNRPNRCNALSLELLDSLLAHLEEIKQNPHCRVLILNGNGQHFCSGLDLYEALLKDDVLVSKEETNIFQNDLERKSFFRFIKNNQEMSSETIAVSQGYWMPHRLLEILLRLKRLPQIVIGAVQGVAYGGGAGIVSACDFVVAAEDFSLSFPVLKYGLLPSLLFPFLRRKLPISDLRRVILTGLPLNAKIAQQLKLVHEIVPLGDLISKSLEFAEQFCIGPSAVAAQAKLMMNELEIPSNDELQKGLAEHWKSWNTPEVEERITAFLKKHSVAVQQQVSESNDDA